MKSYAFALVFLAVSCGKVTPVATTLSTVGQLRTISGLQAVPDFDKNNLAQICNSLAQKEAALPQAIGSTSIFQTAQADCGQQNQLTSNVEVVIQAQGAGNYVFKRKADGLDYIFPQVETTSVGALADLCARQANITNPVVSTSGAVTFFTTQGIADCPLVSGETCIQLEQAAPTTTPDQYVITSREVIRFRTNLALSKAGFFTYRKKVTQSYCAKNEFLTFESTLAK